MFLFQKLNKKIDLSLNMADTGDNPPSDEELSKKERERWFKKHLQCKRTSNGSEETSVDKKNPKKRKINSGLRRRRLSSSNNLKAGLVCGMFIMRPTVNVMLRNWLTLNYHINLSYPSQK